MMSPALAQLVETLAQAAAADYIADLEAQTEGGDEHSEGDQVDNARDTDASTLGKAA